MSERPWCVEHDRSAEFVADFPTQRVVCWIGLSASSCGGPECRIETVTVTRKVPA